MQKLQIQVDKEKCVGSSTCIHVANGLFKLDEDGQAEFIPSTNQSIELLRDAAEACPVGAIEMKEV